MPANHPADAITIAPLEIFFSKFRASSDFSSFSF